MEDLTQTISNLVGILLGVVGAVGVGFFIYGAYLYLTASGAPHQMERGKSAMMTALAGIVLALVAYGVVELVMNAVVDPEHRHRRRAARSRTRLPPCQRPTADRPHVRKEKADERTRGPDSRSSRGQGAAGVHLPAGGGGDGGVRHLLRRLPLRPLRPVRGAHGPGRRPRPGRRGDDRRQDRRSAAAPGGRRPIEVPAGGAALHRAGVPAGEKRTARAGAARQQRPRPPAADGKARRTHLSQAAQDAQEGPQEQGAAQRAEALVRQAQGEGRGQRPRTRPPDRDPGDQATEAPQGPSANRGRRRSRGGGRRRSPRPPWPTVTGRTRSTSSYRSRWKAAGYSWRA